jgi:hypothetical protein
MTTLFIITTILPAMVLLLLALQYLKRRMAEETWFFLKDNSRLLNKIRSLL